MDSEEKSDRAPVPAEKQGGAEIPPAKFEATPAASKGGLGTAAPDRGPRSAFRDRLAYLVARFFLLLFRHLPGCVARFIARRMADTVWLYSSRYRTQMRRHLTIAYRNEMSEAEKSRLIRRNFHHLGLLLVEFSRMNRLTKENVRELVDLSQTKVLDEQLAKGRGLIAVPAHLGNWELSGYSVALLGYPLKSVARPLDNPLLNDMVDKIRERSGNTIIHKWKVLWKLKKLLDHGGIVTMSVDQNGGTSGLFVPLFGVLSSTIGSPAELHLATRAPIAVCTVNRLPDGVHHVLNVWDVIEHVKTGDYDADRLEIVARINRAYERAVRAYPEQWLWVHKRWKTRPPGETLGPDGLPPRVTG
jgi:KDO2-lipid IV(A) lauroyltransferase